jgi:nanoRNase/pAp phosphatase (c-di-AMP/oligoRNAs hydrolase)
MGIKNNTPANLERLDQFLKGCRRLYIFLHDNPDPDCIASGHALKVLLKERLGINSTIIYGGIVGRAENIALLSRCKIPLTPVEKVNFRNIRYSCLLDTQPKSGNNSFPDFLDPVLVIDHHPRKKSTRAKIVDVRPEYGATTTILNEYLAASNNVKVSSTLATSLTYGILSETEFLGRDTTEMDINSYTSLLPKINHRNLSQIIHPPLRKEYFVDLHRAIENAFCYKNVVGTYLLNASYPDIVAQVADLILKSEGRTWAICLGVYNDILYISVRTSNIKGRCGMVMRRLVGKRGTAGGHEMIAGGRILLNGKQTLDIQDLIDEVILDFFQVLGHKGEIQPKKFLSL